jgi:hypothetical protein
MSETAAVAVDSKAPGTQTRRILADDELRAERVSEDVEGTS